MQAQFELLDSDLTQAEHEFEHDILDEDIEDIQGKLEGDTNGESEGDDGNAGDDGDDESDGESDEGRLEDVEHEGGGKARTPSVLLGNLSLLVVTLIMACL